MIYTHEKCPKIKNVKNINRPGVSVAKGDIEEFGEPRFCPWCGQRSLKPKPVSA